MPRYVVDSNFLQNEEFRTFLSSSSSNIAILTDYSAMEAYKAESLNVVYCSMKIPCDFSKQVLILKNTTLLMGLSGRKAGLRRRLINQQETNEFSRYCKQLKRAEVGDKKLQNALIEKQKVARENIRNIQRDAIKLQEEFKNIIKNFSPEQIRVIRRNESLPESMVDKILHDITHLTREICQSNPYVHKVPEDSKALINIYPFRVCLCLYMLQLDYIKNGAITGHKPEKLLNDIVDLSYATVATYFDGLLTSDKKMLNIYSQADFILREIAK